MNAELLISMALNVALLILVYLQGKLTRQALNTGRNALNLLREQIESDNL